MAADGLEPCGKPRRGIADARQPRQARAQGQPGHGQPEGGEPQGQRGKRERGTPGAGPQVEDGRGAQENGADRCEVEQAAMRRTPAACSRP